MSIDETTQPHFSGPDDVVTPETPRPRFRHAITAGASRVRAAAPAQARRAAGAVRRDPVPSAGVLALVGGTIAALIVRRRMARAKAAPARGRWVPARFRP